jgi:hypothetical protein
MKITGKLIARVGALLLLLGFFLPSVAVSCSAMNVKQSFSLAALANQNGKGGLFLVLLAALVIMGLTFISAKMGSTVAFLIVGQLAAAGISLLTLIITLSSTYNQMSQASNLGGMFQGGSSLFTYSLEFGAFILLIGYILVVFGVIRQFSDGESGWSPFHLGEWADRSISILGSKAASDQPVGVSGARLEVVSGLALQSTIPVTDNFIVGRGQQCQLQLHDPGISRQHLRLRFATGVWYLQDMGSSRGTLVNGQPVQATRLNTGDQILIGGTTLIFRM